MVAIAADRWGPDLRAAWSCTDGMARRGRQRLPAVATDEKHVRSFAIMVISIGREYGFGNPRHARSHGGPILALSAPPGL